MHSSNAQVLKAAKELLRRRELREENKTFRNFVRNAWSTLEPSIKFISGWAIDAICDHLQATKDGQIIRLLITVPPGMSKSITSGVFFPAYVWTEWPEARFLGSAHKETLAVRDNRKCRNLIVSEWYQRLYGDRFNLMHDQNEKRKFENDKGGFREATAFTSVTGSRGDFVLLDDPLSVKGGLSAKKLEECATTFTEALPNRVNDPAKSVIIVVMQRLHEKDPAGIILENELDYEHLMLPMEFEPDRRCIIPATGFSDPRTEPGELLFPERFPRAVVERDKKVMRSENGDYAVAAQNQQRPAPRGGGMFKRSWFKIVEAAPVGCVWVRGWDLAGTSSKENASAAYTVGLKMGRAPDGTFYIEDVARDQLSPAGVRKLIKTTAEMDGKSVKGSIPQDPGQAGKDQAQSIIKELAGFNYRSSVESGDKQLRAEPFAAQCEVGNVFIVNGPWVKAFLAEIEVFPAGRFKDQVDAATRAFSELVTKDQGMTKEKLRRLVS